MGRPVIRPKALLRAATLVAMALLTGCGSTRSSGVDWRGRPVGELLAWLGKPSRIRQIAPSLSLYLWLDSPSTWFNDNDTFAPQFTDGFLIRSDGTILGPAKFADPMIGGLQVEEVVKVLGSPTRVAPSVTGNAVYTWEPRPEGAAGEVSSERGEVVYRRLTLVVGRHGTVLDWY